MRRPRPARGCSYRKKNDGSKNRILGVRSIKSGTEIDCTNAYILCTIYEVVRSGCTSLSLSKFILSSISEENW